MAILEPLKDKRSLTLQLRDRLRMMLREKFMRVGDQLPSEEALGRMFGVSRATVREALKLLEEEHIITVRHGLGRFVAYDPENLINEDITRLESVTEMANDLGFDLQTEVLSLVTESPTTEVAARLNLEINERVCILRRIRKADGKVFIYSIDIFPESIASQPLLPEDFQRSLLNLMEQTWGTRLAYSRATISVEMLSEEEVHPVGDIPWILMEQVNFDQHDRPILYSRDYHRGDIFRFHVLRRRR